MQPQPVHENALGAAHYGDTVECDLVECIKMPTGSAIGNLYDAAVFL